MDVYTLLHDDHEHVAALFEELENTSEEGRQARSQLLDDLRFELVMHTEAEEAVFYPALSKHPDTRSQTLEAIEEHRMIRRLLDELSHMDPSSEQWQPKLTVLKETVEHHVREEEKELFPKAREILSAERAEEMADQVEIEKEQRISPAWTAPRTPAGNQESSRR